MKSNKTIHVRVSFTLLHCSLECLSQFVPKLSPTVYLNEITEIYMNIHVLNES